jgi:hypothetical protein
MIENCFYCNQKLQGKCVRGDILHCCLNSECISELGIKFKFFYKNEIASIYNYIIVDNIKYYFVYHYLDGCFLYREKPNSFEDLDNFFIMNSREIKINQNDIIKSMEQITSKFLILAQFQ